MSAMTCPDWCITTAAEHADDDPMRLQHTGPVIAGNSFTVTQMGNDAPMAYFHQCEGEMTAGNLQPTASRPPSGWRPRRE